jgi:2-keto-4-pentenoate hydratase/2-oxohepta-3-ene-1,7-dioic acid hydratase in catechol pathway
VIGNNDAIVIPTGRDRIDWEIEFGTVIGKPARYVSANRAQDYVFGYTVTIDISDRGGRPGSRTSDWFVGKGHETFAPMGPWIVPKEFYGDPMKRLHQQLSIDGVKVQEAKAGDMIHNIWELIEYGSSIITLFPGDVINSGTTGGPSSGAFKRGTRDDRGNHRRHRHAPPPGGGGQTAADRPHGSPAAGGGHLLSGREPSAAVGRLRTLACARPAPGFPGRPPRSFRG